MKKLHLITILLIVSSCSKIRTLEDRTKSMTENTEAMKTTTVTMQDKTSELEAITSHMYPQIRTKETEDTRSDKKLRPLPSIFNPLNFNFGITTILLTLKKLEKNYF
jgi:uncharacterized protein YceK